MRSFYKTAKEISLLVAGALIGIAFIPFEDKISDIFPLIVIIILFLTLVGIGFLEWIYYFWLSFCRKINNWRKRIYIYIPYDIDSDTSSWVTLSKRQLQKALDNIKINYSFGKKEKVFVEYPVVVNPYGGVYPESDLENLQSLAHIFDYVRGGGIYVNIADIPFYYAYDENLKRMVDTTPLAGDFSQVRSFLQTILTRKLHCFVYGLTNGDDFKKGINRIISLQENSKNLFEREIFIGNNTDEKFTPQLAIPYGSGYFVFSTLQITDKNSASILENILNETLTL